MPNDLFLIEQQEMDKIESVAGEVEQALSKIEEMAREADRASARLWELMDKVKARKA
jgi:uncharacterized protein YukE